MADLKVHADGFARFEETMQSMLRLRLLPGALLLAGAPFALAESPLPDPVPPAVIGRPLEQLKPWRPVRPKPAATKPAPPRHTAVRPATAPRVVRQPAPGAQAVAASPGQGAATRRPAKQAVDDRADPRAQVVGEVGKGTRFARKPLGPGAYFGDKHRNAVHAYYEDHPVSAASPNWKIGEPVPRGVRLAPVPRALLASLPALPAGHRYVQLGGEVVLIAAASGVVVDGISRRR